MQWLCGDDAEAKQVVAGLIADAGFVPVDLGGTAGCDKRAAAALELARRHPEDEAAVAGLAQALERIGALPPAFTSPAL